MEEHKKIYLPLFFLTKPLMEKLQQNKGVKQEIRRYEIQDIQHRWGKRKYQMMLKESPSMLTS